MRRVLMVLVLLCLPGLAQAFCGFYVARSDGRLLNETSKVVYTRNGVFSTITMSSDYQGPASEFALVVPTPSVLERDDIRTVDPEIIAHLDRYTAPRLVEYFDDDPCLFDVVEPVMAMPVITSDGGQTPAVQPKSGPRALGVTVEASYAVGSYDIEILSAKRSDGLVTYLTQEGYKLPDGATPVLGDYIGAGMKFFVAKVNLARHDAGAAQELQPLQIRFRSRDFMLPIQLGKLNAEAPQTAVFYMLTSSGRVEVANYTATELPTNVDVPAFIEQMFPLFYTSVFQKAVGDRGGLVLEYGWDMGWCDPCADDPVPNEDLRILGARWLEPSDAPGEGVYVTRYRARYTKEQMPRDIMFKTTKNRDNFQGRYVIRHPFDGPMQCEAAETYIAATRERLAEEAKTTVEMTGWDPGLVSRNIGRSVPAAYR
ncbi:DUF2330 domain-containing protein [Dinoroseobacter sp. S375]|uniref:DUF2330 domain-containing protein n=1 Tax=Dinoroseobacter sp. S375 TaxID=3415136 RepID=UPI003C7B6F90